MAEWETKGLRIHFMTLLLDGPGEGPASVEGAQTWREIYGLSRPYVAADPGYAMVSGGQFGTPQITIIDPRTMQVVSVTEGWPGFYPWKLTELVEANKSN